jgi:hypothetical protein
MAPVLEDNVSSKSEQTNRLDSPLDGITFLDASVVTEKGDTDVVGLQVQGHTSDTRGEFNHFFGLNVSETVDSSDTITDGQDSTSLFELTTGGSTGDSAFQDGRDFRSGCGTEGT